MLYSVFYSPQLLYIFATINSIRSHFSINWPHKKKNQTTLNHHNHSFHYLISMKNALFSSIMHFSNLKNHLITSPNTNLFSPNKFTFVSNTHTPDIPISQIVSHAKYSCVQFHHHIRTLSKHFSLFRN